LIVYRNFNVAHYAISDEHFLSFTNKWIDANLSPILASSRLSPTFEVRETHARVSKRVSVVHCIALVLNVIGLQTLLGFLQNSLDHIIGLQTKFARPRQHFHKLWLENRT